MPKVLVYYFAFPHYRREILKELHDLTNGNLVVAGGVIGRRSVKTLTKDDISFLTQLETVHFGPFEWQRRIVRRAVSQEFDAVVLGPATLSISTWVILVLRRLLRRRTYLWGQCGRVGEHTPKRYVQEVMNRFAHGLLVYGESEAAAAMDFGTPRQKVHIVNNATHKNEKYIDPEISAMAYRRLQERTRQAVEERRLTLAYVGRLSEAKRMSGLFEAARILHSRYEHLRVIVIGGGGEEAVLRRKYQDPFIEYLGWVYNNEDLNQLLEDSTLIVSPYHMGLLAVDALRMGVPVLIPDNPQNGSEVEALTEGINSARFARGDSNAIADAVDRWLCAAPNITQEEYAQARDSALRRWSPGSVARNILRATQYST